MHHAQHCTLPIHPRTGLRAVGVVNGRPVWPILGGSGEGGEVGTGDGGAGQGGSGAAYTPPASQADLDRIVESRLARERNKLSSQYADYDEIKAKAEKHDALEAELGSTADKAAKAARDEERAKILGESIPRVVRAEFKAAAKGVLSADQLTALLEDLDLTKYVTDKGDADEGKIEKKVTAFAPAGGGGNGKTSPPRALGQGNHQQATPKPGDAGRAAAEKRFGKKQQ